MSKCLVETLDCIVSNPNVNEYLGELRVNLRGASGSSGNLILRPITGGSPTATYNGTSIITDGTTQCAANGLLIIGNKYDLRVLQYADRAASPTDAFSFSYCKGMEVINCTALLTGDIANLGGLTSLTKLMVAQSLELTGDIIDIAACPITQMDIYNTKVYGSLEKYIAKRVELQQVSTGYFTFGGILGKVTFKGSVINYSNLIRKVEWSPNTNPLYIDIIFDSTNQHPITETIDANGNPVV